MSVSVIIPCFNQGHFLGEAIESVLSQTYPSIEIIVVDDGSTDDTSEIAEAYSGVRCIKQDNKGLCDARLTGFSNSNGKFVLFLDADDRLPPKAIQYGMEALACSPEAVFAFGGLRRISPHGSAIGERKQKVIQDFYLELLKDNYIPTPGMVLFKRSCFDEFEFFSGRFPATADYELYLRVTRRRPVVSYSNCVVERRVHPESMSKNAALMLRSVLKVHKGQLQHVKGRNDFLEAYKEGRRFWKRWYGGQLAANLRWLRYQREWAAFISGLGALLRLSPGQLKNAISPARISEAIYIDSDLNFEKVTRHSDLSEIYPKLLGVSQIFPKTKYQDKRDPNVIILSLNCENVHVGTRLLINGSPFESVFVNSNSMLVYVSKDILSGNHRNKLQLIY